jgi:hypothetical protein
METENIESLLMRLIEVNETISDQLTDMKLDLHEIRSELDWVEDLSFAKHTNDALTAIESHLGNIETNTSSLGD